jgi:hypothetical protein
LTSSTVFIPDIYLIESQNITSHVSQAGVCERRPKGIEEEEIMRKAIAVPAPPPATTTESRSSASKEKKIRKY